MSNNLVLAVERLKSVLGSKDTNLATNSLDTIEQFFSYESSPSEQGLKRKTIFILCIRVFRGISVVFLSKKVKETLPHFL